MALNLTGNDLDDPDQTLYENFTCGARRNYDGDCNPEVDKMVDRQPMEFDQAKRKELVRAIERGWRKMRPARSSITAVPAPAGNPT